MIQKIGVIGAGQMGNGIAHVCALAGYDVVLNDISKEQLDKALQTIDENMVRQVSRGHISDADREGALKRLSTATSLESFSDIDLAIESATEDESVKRKILEDLCIHLNQDALIATNTSSI